MRVKHLPIVLGAELNSYGIDGKVAPKEVVPDRAGLYGGQSARPFICLRAGRNQVDAPPVQV
jgi:hypothetical protein